MICVICFSSLILYFMYDLVIIGGGPAGVAAGIYAARKKIKTVLITDTFGGQSLVSDHIGNWIGEKEISGFDLAQKMEAHLKAQKGIEIVESEWVTSIERTTMSHPEPSFMSRFETSSVSHPESASSADEGPSNVSVGPCFMVKTKDGKSFATKTVLLAAGSRRKKLNVHGEKEFEGKGVVYCSTCDAPLFDGKDVAVVGGGNSGLESVVDLLPYAQTIFLLHHGSALKGDPITQEKIKADPKVHIILNAETQSITGEKGVAGLIYRDTVSGDMKTLSVQGVFVEIGIIPNGDILKDMCEINKAGEVIVNHKTQKTSCAGIWAAGDASDVLYKQNNISAGDAVKAVLNIYDYLRGVERG